MDMRNINRLLNLFGRYPAVHNRLLDFLPQQEGETTKGGRLFGDENITLPYLYYRCENGPHVMVLRKVENRDAAGRALCPHHLNPMSHINSPHFPPPIYHLPPDL